MKADDLSRMAFRWTTSVVITWAFLAALMTATAQQRVTAILDGRPDKLTYSAALERAKTVSETRTQMLATQQTSTKLGDQIQAEQATLDERQAALNRAWEDLDLATLSQQAKQGGCDMSPAATNLDPRLKTWELLVGCWRAGVLSSRPSAAMKIAYGGDEDYGRLATAVAEAALSKAHLADKQLRVDADVAAKKKLVDEGDSLSASFAETSILHSPWLGFGFLVDVPPSLLQILLAFLSGGFGALLVTLVLVVYPKSALAGAAGQEYGSRLLLGGLIAVGVFVILSGGSAVLGTAGPFAQTQPNFMTFSAVGVLAGMFSDRVAAWLSERANAFFSDHKEPPDAKPGDANVAKLAPRS